MAIVLRPADWVSTNAYAVGDRVTYNGVGYQAEEAVAAVVAPAANPIPVGNTDWRAFAVFEITDYYSLQEDVLLELNTDSDQICASVPKFIQAAEVIMSKFLRSPAQRVTRRFSVDSNGAFQIPSDVIEIEHLRTDDTDGSDRTLLERGSISIQKTNRTVYEEVRQYYRSNPFFSGEIYQYPVYYVEGADIRIAPVYETGTDILMTYWQKVPQLGRTGLRTRTVNNVAEPINAQNQTMAEWVAAGNAAGDFVQATQVVTRNLWTATTPELLKAAACVEGFKAKQEFDSVQVWQSRFDTIGSLTVEEFKKFETSGSQSVRQKTVYCG